MKMTLKKEVKHSVVYETQDDKAPCRSIYVNKLFLIPLSEPVPHHYPESINLEITVPQ